MPRQGHFSNLPPRSGLRSQGPVPPFECTFVPIRTGNMNGEGDKQAQAVPGEVKPGGNDLLQDQEGEVQEGGSQNGSQDVHSDDEEVFSLADDGEGENSCLIIDEKLKLTAPRQPARLSYQTFHAHFFSAI